MLIAKNVLIPITNETNLNLYIKIYCMTLMPHVKPYNY